MKTKYQLHVEEYVGMEEFNIIHRPGRSATVFSGGDGKLLIKKEMFGNSSNYHDRHEEVIDILQSHKIFPEIYEYNNEYYIMEYIEDSVPLYEYIEQTGDMEFGLSVLLEMFKFMIELGKHTKDNLHLMGDDLHMHNIIVSPNKNFYVVDLDQFGWFYKKDYLSHLHLQMNRLTYYFEKAMKSYSTIQLETLVHQQRKSMLKYLKEE